MAIQIVPVTAVSLHFEGSLVGVPGFNGQVENIYSILVFELILKFDKFNIFKDLHPRNIPLIFLMFSVLKL